MKIPLSLMLLTVAAAAAAAAAQNAPIFVHRLEIVVKCSNPPDSFNVVVNNRDEYRAQREPDRIIWYADLGAGKIDARTAVLSARLGDGRRTGCAKATIARIPGSNASVAQFQLECLNDNRGWQRLAITPAPPRLSVTPLRVVPGRVHCADAGTPMNGGTTLYDVAPFAEQLFIHFGEAAPRFNERYWLRIAGGELASKPLGPKLTVTSTVIADDFVFRQGRNSPNARAAVKDKLKTLGFEAITLEREP